MATYDVLSSFLGISRVIMISDDLTIFQVNRTREKPCVLRGMFCEIDVRRKSMVTLVALSQVLKL